MRYPSLDTATDPMTTKSSETESSMPDDKTVILLTMKEPRSNSSNFNNVQSYQPQNVWHLYRQGEWDLQLNCEPSLTMETSRKYY